MDFQECATSTQDQDDNDDNNGSKRLRDTDTEWRWWRRWRPWRWWWTISTGGFHKFIAWKAKYCQVLLPPAAALHPSSQQQEQEQRDQGITLQLQPGSQRAVGYKWWWIRSKGAPAPQRKWVGDRANKWRSCAQVLLLKCTCCTWFVRMGQFSFPLENCDGK